MRKRWPMEALILACAFVAAGTGIATYHAVGHGGHVEIGPAALTHARRVKVPSQRRQHTEARVPRPRESDNAVVPLPFLRGGTHDPKVLLTTAKDLQWLRLDLSLDEVWLAKPFASWLERYDGFWPSQVVPIYAPGHHLDGLELRVIPAESPLREAGFAEGDQLLGIDGYTFTDDTFRNVDVIEARKRGWAVVEIARANHHVVLSIHWPVR